MSDPTQRPLGRRTFLGILGGAGVASVAAGCSPKPAVQRIVPYLVPPDDVVPGTPLFYRSACRECPAGCGVTVRTREGRAVKLEGNPDDPIGRGALCARGQAGVQALYHPERFRGPLRRGVDGALAPLPWDEAEDALAKAVAAAVAKGPGRVRMLTRLERGATGAIQRAFLAACGARPHDRVVLDPLDPAPLRAASAALFGRAELPVFDLSEARSVVALGAELVESWSSPVELSRQLAQGRVREGDARTRLTWIGPRLALTGVSADRWLRARSGGEAAVALGMLRALVDPANGVKDLAPEARALWPRLASLAPAALAERAGVPWPEIERLARELAARRPSAILAPGAQSQGRDATRLAGLALVLNAALGNVGRTVRYGLDPHVGRGLPARRRARAPARLRGRAGGRAPRRPRRSARAPAGGDRGRRRAREGPARRGVRAAPRPDHRARPPRPRRPPRARDLRRRGAPRRDREPRAARDDAAPRHPRRDAGARRGRRAPSHPDGAPLGRPLRRRCGPVRGARGTGRGGIARTGSPGGAAARRPLDGGGGGPRPRASGRGAAEPFLAPSPPPDPAPGLDLVPFPTALRGDAGAADLPWLREVPDTVSSVSWTAWLEVSPATAARLGLATGELAAVATSAGRAELPVYVYPGIRDDAVALPLGAEVAALLPALADEGSGALAFAGARATVTRVGRRTSLPLLEGSPYQHGRDVVPAVTAAAPSPHRPDLSARMYAEPPHPEHRWAMTIDLDRCTGCEACVVACFAENNVPVMGPEAAAQGRYMGWLRIERYLGDEPGGALDVRLLPMLCQQCTSAPCEPVCPVYATYHTPEGLNAQVYNRCVGTRYCSNNCPYKVRTFNWRDARFERPLDMQLNPDVTVRSRGVMEKCTFCIQRIRYAEGRARDEQRPVADGEVVPACAQTCAAQAIVFGDANDPASRVSQIARDRRAFQALEDLGTRPAITYLARTRDGEEGDR